MSNIEDRDQQQSPESQRQAEQGRVISALDALSNHAQHCVKIMGNQSPNVVEATQLDSQEHQNGRTI